MKRGVLTEARLRAMGRKLGEMVLEPGTIVTPSARDYARQQGIKLVFRAPAPPEPAPAPAPACPGGEAPTARFVCGYSGAKIEEKPEHFTHLHGNFLVRKDHPRIVFRGRLDMIQAAVIHAQAVAARAGEPDLVADLGQVLALMKSLMKAEVQDAAVPQVSLFGFDEDKLRAASHDPGAHVGAGHVVPAADMGELGAELNLLRTLIREAELMAVAAFCEAADKPPERPDILKAMNRLSSAIYILMCKYFGEKL